MKRVIALLIVLCLAIGLCSAVFAAPAGDAGEAVEAAESAEGESAEGESADSEGEDAAPAEAAEGESADSEGEDAAAAEAADGESADSEGEDAAAAETADGESADSEGTDAAAAESGDTESSGESADGESADLEALNESLGGSADTELGGAATSTPPDNSTRPINILGPRAAIYFEYTEDGYVLSKNITDAYTVEGADDLAIPTVGEEYVISGLHIKCDREDWDAENTVGNSGIIFNALDDVETTFVIGGQDDVYEAPNGQQYNSVIELYVDPDEPYDNSAQETAPGVGVCINGKRLTLNNVYVESNGYNRPSVYVPTYNNDWNNVKILPELVCADCYFMNHSTRDLLLMGSDVWFLNSTAMTDNWGALSYDFTSAALYMVNSVAYNNAAGYTIYDAAQCNAHLYGSKLTSAGIGIMVARDATLDTDVLSAADETATEPYCGTADLLEPSATEDGRTVLIGYGNPVKIHADMSAADTVAVVNLKDTYLSSMAEDVVMYDGSEFDPENGGSSGRQSSGISSVYNDYTNGAAVAISCHNGSVTFDNCEVKSRTGVLVQSFYSHDTMASGIFPVDGAEYAGDSVTIKNMAAEGDILHEDWMRKMVVSIENAQLTGKVTGTTLTGWNNYWREQLAAMDAAEGDEATAIRDEVYETLWGVRMSVDGTSTWNVTETSQLYSFVAAEGAVIQPAEGKTMTIYVDCPMGNDLEAYDISAGTQIDAFEPGVEYSGVMIVVE